MNKVNSQGLTWNGLDLAKPVVRQKVYHSRIKVEVKDQDKKPTLLDLVAV